MFSERSWERRFMSPEFRRTQLEQRRREKTGPDLGDVLGFGLPIVLTISLAIDGLAGTGFVFYNPILSFPIPWADPLQAVGAVLLFIALPTLTSAAYLAAKDVYS